MHNTDEPGHTLQPQHDDGLMINGLTQEETAATASCAGLMREGSLVAEGDGGEGSTAKPQEPGRDSGAPKESCASPAAAGAQEGPAERNLHNVERAMTLASIFAGSVAMSDRDLADQHRRELRNFLLAHMRATPAQEGVPAEALAEQGKIPPPAGWEGRMTDEERVAKLKRWLSIAQDLEQQAAHPTPAQAAPQAETPAAPDERGWLIEHSGELPGVEERGRVTWLRVGPKFDGFGAQEFGFTPDASKALRFARKEDAEAVLKMHMGANPPDWYRSAYSVTEHLWPAAPQAPAAGAEVAPSDGTVRAIHPPEFPPASEFILSWPKEHIWAHGCLTGWRCGDFDDRAPPAAVKQSLTAAPDLTDELINRVFRATARLITDKQIDDICWPDRSSRWKNYGRQYDRDTVRLVLAALADLPVDAARAEPAGGRDERDAERYRWLRDVSTPPHNFYLSVPVEFHSVRYTPAEVDAAIDAARASLATHQPPTPKESGHG
jgi:hypothetical protein